MENNGWDNVIQPVVSASNEKYASARTSAWISQQQEEYHNGADKSGFNSPMWTNRNHPSFATLDDIIDRTTNANNESDLTIFGSGISATSNAFSQQHQNLSSSGSSQLSDFVLSTGTPLYFPEDHFIANESTNTNSIAVNLHGECNVISSNDTVVPMRPSRKRKSPEAQKKMINSNGVSKKRKINDQLIELTFGSNINDNILDYSSSSAEGGGTGNGFSRLIASSLHKSSNINFKLQEISSETDAPDSETIAEMKEMIYRAAAFRPVNLGLDEVVEKPKRKNVKISSDPQTAAARQRRERISDRIRVLQRIVPGGNKMDTATMLDEAANYLKFLRSQVKALEKSVPTGSFGFSSYNFLP